MKTELKRKLIVTLVAPALGLAAAGSFAAGGMYETKQPAADMQQGATTQETKEITTSGVAQDMRASKLIGMKVRNPQGERLGKINDLIVDVNNERVHYAVLAFGGALGMGDKLFAYPVTMFRPATERDELVLNVDREKLKQAPGFEREHWPDWGKSRYRSDVERYFGPTVAIKPMANERLVRASELIGKDVDDRTGRRAGEIDDLVVNLGNGRVHYAVLEFDKAWSTNDKLLPVSLKALHFPAERKKDLALNVDRNQLDMSSGFAENSWPDLNDPAFQREVDSHLRGGRSVSGPAGPEMTR